MQAGLHNADRAAPEAASLLEILGLTKAFPGVLAVDGVTLSIGAGGILALLGANGAGKSTLIQVVSGVHPHGSYSGAMRMNGVAFRPTSVAEAEAGGVAFLAQEVNVAPHLSVAQTLWLNVEPTRRGLIDVPRMLAGARDALQAFGLDIDPRTEMGALDLATQQLVLIVRALSKNARLLILDEPTAALNEREASRLFERMRALTGRGVAVVFVSHRLAEVFEVSDRIVVMRDGRIAGEHATDAVSRDAVVEQMVGARTAGVRAAGMRARGSVALEARGLSVAGADGKRLVEGLDLALHRGEILGLFGLLGSGVVETAMALFGAWDGPVGGELQLNGQPVAIAAPSDAVRAGIGLIGQDRRDGLAREHSILANAMLADLPGLSGRAGFLDLMRARREIADVAARLRIKAASIDVEVGTLSGGNQQKVQVARWLAAGVETLILIDPMRGVDVGARAEISRIWIELAEAGAAILLVSSDAEELIEICDRVVVLRGGRAVAEVGRAELGEERLLRLAAGLGEGREVR